MADISNISERTVGNVGQHTSLSPPQSSSTSTAAAAEVANDHDNINENIQRRERKRSKKEAARQRRLARIAKNGGPPETTFLGKHKWLGGAVDPDTGYIYGIPSHAHQIICIKPPQPSSAMANTDGTDATTVDTTTTDDTTTTTTTTTTAEITTIPLPNEIQQGHFKWLRGLVHDGHLYGIPAWNTAGVLKVELSTQKVNILPLPRSKDNYESDPIPWKEKVEEVDRGRWMWHGGAVGKAPSKENGEEGAAAIYCPPSNAEYVLKVCLDGSDRVEEIGPPLSDGQNKWYGGILGVDGCVYAPPYTATGVLRIDPKNNDKVEVLGNFPRGKYLWHGGLLAKSTGVIYAFPAHSNEVLCIDTNVRKRGSLGKSVNHDDDVGGVEDDESWRVSTIPIHRHDDDIDSPDLQYKWLGGSYGADGCIYGMPSDATTILRIDPITNTATTFGRVSNTNNKWQGGVLSQIDKCIYAVPADDSTVLRIDTDPDTPSFTPTLAIDYVGSGFQDIDDKWQGGFVGRDERIYAIPENCNHVMVIDPGVGVAGGEKKKSSAVMLTGLEDS